MTITLAESYKYCKSLSQKTARNFYYSFLGLPDDQFRAMCVLYAFMRITDDIGDDGSKPTKDRVVELARWDEQLQFALQERRFEHIVFPALRDIVDRYHIPAGDLAAVIEGVRMDLSPVEFQTFDQLAQYCYHVAGSVGLCCIHIWGFHDERAKASAIDCGLAFQLTNLLRDLGEDVDMGRIYLPREDLEQFDYSIDDLKAHRTDDRFRSLMAFQTARAKSYYQKSESLFDYIKPPGKPILRAMLRIYGGLLSEIERCDYDVFTRPISLPTWKKLLIAADTFVRRPWFGSRSE